MNHIGREQLPSQPLLPVVTAETIETWTTNLPDAENPLQVMFEQMRDEQVLIATAIAELAGSTARDVEEADRMLDSASVVYGLLREQAQANRRRSQTEN
jgi:hypothetical protein